MEAERRAQRARIHEQLDTYRRYLAGEVAECGALPDRMEAALVEMTDQEREIIKKRYLTQERAYNWKTAVELNMTLANFNKRMANAIEKINFALVGLADVSGEE